MSTPAIPAVQKVRKTMFWTIVIVTGIIVLIGITYLVATYQKTPTVRAKSSSQVADVLPENLPQQTIRVAANSNSDPVYTKPGYTTPFTGPAGFTTHCVYRDGRPEGIVGDPTNPCVDGPMQYVYVRNKTDKEIAITYVYQKKK